MNTIEQAPANHSRNGQLKLVVFIAGAVLMALEMTGSRVLAIHFGSSIYVWGAIIGIFLTALSAGYFAGGMLADRWPTFTVLSILVLIAGVWIALIPLYANRVCRAILQLNTGERPGPLIATLILFGGPSVLLGMVSPYAVRIAARAIESMGNVAGRLYALSTFGSIVGTLLTAFWLIPAVGVRALLQVLGLCLILLTLVSLAATRKRRIIVGTILVVCAVFVLVGVRRNTTERGNNQTVVYEGDSVYHYILVVDDVRRNARFLQFNNYIESGIDLNPPYATRVSYTNGFELARIFKPKLERILIIGGGGGVGARKFVEDDPETRVDLVEIDPLVVDLSLKFFHLQPSDRLHVHVDDGRNFVRRTKDKYDLVILDAFTIGGQIPFHLTTKEFMQEIQQVLTPDGLLLANINGSLVGSRSRIVRAEFKTASEVFGNVYLFPHLHELERKQASLFDQRSPRSIILIAVRGGNRWTKELIANMALQLQKSGTVRTPTFLEDAMQFFDDPLSVADVPLLTDDYAPVDIMVL
jgi:spermidine synthase